MQYYFWELFNMMWMLVPLGIGALIVWWVMKNKNKPAGQPKGNRDQIILGIALCVMTIVFFQQIMNIMFPESGTPRIVAKLVIDTALIALGLGLKHKVVGNAILYAGVLRFVFIFFQMQGMEPFLRIIVILFVVIALFVVGVIKFNKNHSKEGI